MENKIYIDFIVNDTASTWFLDFCCSKYDKMYMYPLLTVDMTVIYASKNFVVKSNGFPKVYSAINTLHHVHFKYILFIGIYFWDFIMGISSCTSNY